MASWPSIFDLCKPRREVLAGELPDAIFAADLWDVISGTAHRDYRDPVRFFTGTHPTENLKLLVKEVSERLAGVSGGTPIFRRSYWIPGSYVTRSSMSAGSNAFPRLRTLCTNSKNPK